MNLRRSPYGPALALPLHMHHGLLHRLQGLVSFLQRADLAVLVLDSTLGSEAIRAADCLRGLVLVLLLGPLEAVFVELAAILPQFAEGLHRVSDFDLQARFELALLVATAFEAVAEFERAPVALGGLSDRWAVSLDARRHGFYCAITPC